MRKSFLTFIVGLMFCMLLGFSSCNSCSKQEVQPTEETAEVVKPAEKANLVIENLVSMDRQDMYANFAKDYRWFETCVVLKDFLDEDCDGTVTGVSNIFQAVVEKDNGADVFVVMYTHTPDTSAIEKVHSFWVEDLPMENEAIKLTFKEAFEKVMQTNAPKPHSKHVVLRKELGPINCNPQYIFGNQRAQLYVDAVTGDVRTDNPVFPKDKGFKMPLGEWP